MKIVLLVAICIANGVYSREEIDEDSFAQLTDELLHEIEKRLQDDPETFDALAKSGLFEGILPECQRIISNNSIIKTDTSLKNGALFLGTPNVKSFDECFEQCCDTDKCTTAIFKSREDAMACYLFNCGSPNLCEFTDHADFYVMSVTQSPTKIAENHESELDNLVPVETSTTSTVTSTPTTSTPSTTTELRPPSALFGTCRTAKNCAGTATDCLAGYCVCQDGYHAQDGTCRKDCTRFQFECRNDGNPLTYPQCIAIYDKCDGIQHCTDNSDEENCPSDVINEQSGIQGPNSYRQNQNLAQQLNPINSLQAVDQNPVYQNQPIDYQNVPSSYQNRRPQTDYQNHLQQTDYQNPVPSYPNSQSGYVNVPQAGQGQIGQLPQPGVPGLPGSQYQQFNSPADAAYNTGVQNAPVDGQGGQGFVQNPVNVGGYQIEQQQSGGVNLNAPVVNQGGPMLTPPEKSLNRVRPYPDELSPWPKNNANQKNPDQSGIASNPVDNQSIYRQSGSFDPRPPKSQPASILDDYGPGQAWAQQGAQPGRNQAVMHAGIGAKKFHEYGPTAPPPTSASTVTTQAPTTAKTPKPSQRPLAADRAESGGGSQPSRGRYISEGGYVGGSRLGNFKHAGYETRPKDDNAGPEPSAYGDGYSGYRKNFRDESYVRPPYKGDGYANPAYKQPYSYDDAGFNTGSKYGQRGYPGYSGRTWNGSPYRVGSGGLGSVYQDEDPGWYHYAFPNQYDYYGAGNPSDAKPNPKDDSQPPTVDVVDAGDKQVVPDSDLGQHEPDTGEKSTEVESTENKDEDIPTDSETGGESSPEPSSEVHDEDPNQAQESDQSEESSESSEEGKDLHEGSKEKGKGDGHHDNKTFSVVEEDLIVVKDISSQSNKTAVVALSLGLIITAMLLLFVGCRLRNVRKRLRKGRPMNSNEADYLINGMYL